MKLLWKLKYESYNDNDGEKHIQSVGVHVDVDFSVNQLQYMYIEIVWN